MNSFNRNQIRIAVIAALAVVVTIVLAFVVKGDGEATTHYYLALFPVLLAEVLLGGTAFISAGEEKGAIVRRTALAVVPAVYLGFALFMVVVGLIVTSDKWYAILQVIGLLGALAFAAMTAMAAEASEKDEKATKKSFVSRTDWRLDIEQAASDAAEAFPDRPEVVKTIRKAAEKAQFAAETLAGHEDLDDSVHAAVSALTDAVSSKDSTTIFQAVKAFERAADLREKRIKAAR